MEQIVSRRQANWHLAVPNISSLRPGFTHGHIPSSPSRSFKSCAISTPFLAHSANMVGPILLPRHATIANAASFSQLDKLLGMAMLIVASTVFLYYTIWTLFMVGFSL